jgi:hypothetical protein
MCVRRATCTYAAAACIHASSEACTWPAEMTFFTQINHSVIRSRYLETWTFFFDKGDGPSLCINRCIRPLETWTCTWGTGDNKGDPQDGSGFHLHRRRRSARLWWPVMPWRYGGSRPLIGGRVPISCFRFFSCLIWDDEAVATSWNQNKVLSVLSLLWWCV